MKPFLSRLLPALKNLTISVPPSDHTLANGIHADDNGATHITQAWVWGRLAAWLRPGDFLFADTGTAAFGFTEHPFPANFSFQTQSYYGSIGWATPAALGCAAALRELAQETNDPQRRRTLLITGDGSFQLTMAEVGTMIARGLEPIIMVINNAGYTIERIIHGAKQGYNDIAPYNFRYTLQLFGMSDEQAKQNFRRVRTKAEMEEVLGSKAFEEQEGVKMVEVMMEKIDAPVKLVEQLAMRGEEQIVKMKEAGFMK